MEFVTLCGRPGVGKLTVARQLCAATGFANFHNHLVVDALLALFPFGSSAFVELREATWLGLLDRALAEATLPGIVFTLAWDRTLALDFLARLHRRVVDRGARFHCAELACHPDELALRLASPQRAGGGKLNDPAFHATLDRAGAFPARDMPEGAVRLDITTVAPDDAARQLRALFGLTGACGS